MAKILMLLSNPYRPDPRVRREAQSLAKHGFKVTVAAWNRKGEKSREEKDGPVRIVRFGPENNPQGFRSMVFGLPSFWRHAKKWALGEGGWDIIHAHDFDTLPLGLKLGKKLGVPVIYDAHELYSEMVKEDVPGFVYKMLAKKEKKCVAQANAVVTVNDAIAAVIRGWGAKKVVTVMNCQDPSMQVEVKEKIILPKKGFSALYVGVLEPQRKLVEMARDMAKKAPDIELFIGGFGSLEKEIKEAASRNVKLLGAIPSEKVPELSRQADVLIALYDPAHTNNRLGSPNKLFEAMQYGRPIIVAKGSWAGDLVERESIGMAIEFDGDEVYHAMARLKDHPEEAAEMARKGMKAAQREYNWGVQESKLLSIHTSFLSAKK
ncbi:MAG: glycosyltransferase family 4 protein [Candidatus Thermoplasmatota archaeon]|nr:glycosyltransferase family 4 protein [Candidatus Thermoplasmatota archaeon]